MELSAYLAASYLVVPVLVATQEIHRGTYVASHIVGHDARVTWRKKGTAPFRRSLSP